MGAGDNIVPHVQLHEAFEIVHNKTQHIESAMAVNGTSRAMQGSDYMRLRARVAATGVRTENPKPLTPTLLHIVSKPRSDRVAVFIALAV